MAAALDHRHTRKYFLCPFEESPNARTVFPAKPLRIIRRHVHGTPKPTCPLQMRSIKMRMANHNRAQPALLINKINSRFINKRNQVPENVSMGRLEQDRALAYPQLLAGGGAVGEAGGQFGGRFGRGGEVVDAGVVGVGLEGVFLGGEGGVQGGPGLAVGGDVLAGVLGGLVGWVWGGCVGVVWLERRWWEWCSCSWGGLTSLTRQMRHSLGGEERGTSYCVPQVSQMARSPDWNFMVGG